jgi:hypothetical protein
MSDYTIKSQGAFSGQAEAVSHKYNKYIGKSGNTWLVSTEDDAASNVYVTNNPKNTSNSKDSMAGFGGATLSFPLVDGTTFELHGGWHSNSDALFSDTGVDVRDKLYTFVVLSKGREFPKNGYWMGVMTDVVYKDEKPTLGNYYRYKELIKQYPEAKFQYMESSGGSVSGMILDEDRK